MVYNYKASSEVNTKDILNLPSTSAIPATLTTSTTRLPARGTLEPKISINVIVHLETIIKDNIF